jgi:DNA-binding MarR family transcriptional regulator
MQMQPRPTATNSRNDSASRSDLVRILNAVRALNHSIRVSGRAAEQHLGISSAQHHILQELSERPAQSINELAANSYTHQSSVSMVVRRLLEKGLVKRQHSAQDARRVAISLTSTGRALIRKAPSTWDSRFLAGLRGLSRSELRSIAACLTTLAEVTGADEGGAEMDAPAGP